MGHSWGKIDHYGFVPFSYICPSFNKKTIRVSMITVNKKWLRLIGIVGCTVWMASCKQATDAGVKPSFAIMEVKAADKELSGLPYFVTNRRSGSSCERISATGGLYTG